MNEELDIFKPVILTTPIEEDDETEAGAAASSEVIFGG